MPSDRLRFAIAGVGVAERYHAQAIAATPGAQLVAVCRGGREKAYEAAAAFGVPCETAYGRLLERSDVDAVCVCSPSDQHAAQAVSAARAGKHVLVEKPMALSLVDADAMIAAAQASGVRLAVAFQRRTEPSYAALREAVAASVLGRPVLGSASIPYYRTPAYYASAGWRGTWAHDGGGALMNQGIHLVDLLLWFMGDVAEVQATARTITHDVEVEDCLAASLRFESGALGSLLATTAAVPGFPHRIEVYGDRGGVQIEGDTVVRWEGDARRPDLEAQAPAAAGAGASPTGLAPTGHIRLLHDFVAAVGEGRPPLVTGEEGRRSLALVLAVYEAARTGCSVRPER
jgi:predicted dehydrogenase